jgi:tRNA (guanine6-N2)-methyltransferase
MIELVTHPGFEDVALAELSVAAGFQPAADLRPDGLAGHVRVLSDVPQPLVRGMRSLSRFVRPVASFPLDPADPLGGIRAALRDLAPTIPELAADVTFRVTSARTGEHAFTSEDVARIAGAGVRDALPRAVRMKGFDVELRCDVRDREVRVGVQVTLPKRAHGPFRPTTTLKPTFAWCLLALLERPPVRLLDPFCGAGTILMESTAPELFGSDLHETAVLGARQNLGDRAVIRQGDARRLEEVWPEGGFDSIVTNPPFGRRLGTNVDLEALYAAFLRSAARVTTEDARLVAVIERRGAFNRALRASGWETRHVRIVELGGIYVGVFVLGRG